MKLLEFIQKDYKGAEAVKTFNLGFSTPTSERELPRLIYMKITAQSIGRAQEPAPVREPIYLMWEDFFTEWRANAPQGIQRCF